MATTREHIEKMIAKNNVDIIAIGNGTAGRETERFVQSIRFTKEVRAYIVSEVKTKLDLILISSGEAIPICI